MTSCNSNTINYYIFIECSVDPICISISAVCEKKKTKKLTKSIKRNTNLILKFILKVFTNIIKKNTTGSTENTFNKVIK